MTTVSDLDGFFKVVYGDKLVNLIPEALHIQKMTPLKSARMIGRQFEFPVLVTTEHGVTYAASGAGVFALNAAGNSETQNAIVDGAQIVNRGVLGYEAAAKGIKGTRAFADATKFQVKLLNDSTRNRLEMANLYGQSVRGIGATTLSANIGATSTLVTIIDDDWAAGMWAALEGAAIEFREIGDLANLVSADADAVFVVQTVNVSDRTLVVSGTATGITALNSDISGNPQAIFFQGAFLTEHVGLDRIITNTGVLFSIDAGVHGLWQGNTFDGSAAALTFELVNESIANAVARGLDEGATVFLSPSNWNRVLNDQTALRRFQSEVKTLTNGAMTIEFHSQNGTLEFVSHKFVKDGDVYIVPMSTINRIGAQEVSFELPGTPGQIFRHLDSQAGFEFRAYSNQAIIASEPAKLTKMTNFT